MQHHHHHHHQHGHGPHSAPGLGGRATNLGLTAHSTIAGGFDETQMSDTSEELEHFQFAHSPADSESSEPRLLATT